ncbi:MAM and LDL-receptor class A domain-containing protein 1-like 1 [Homarus americanus]|uniref:MAM and LDL-receptor class A domain-containing protein 1-like 1 n=1 Tax=Homarus americanus TaxID=6706 RepID=A0A8J5NB20_HOMAM|nr:MAM and LDL-receptor class A domain-containing protein 1-like 1 [Homarus americanus]
MSSARAPLVVLLAASSIWLPLAVSQSADDCAFDNEGGTISTCNLVMNATPFRLKSWKTGTGITTNYRGGPGVDAQQSNEGGYAFASTSDMLQDFPLPTKAWMITSPNNSTDSLGRCLEFAFASEGLCVESLEVLMVMYKTNDVDEIFFNNTLTKDYQVMSLWRTRQSTKAEWKKAQVTFSAPTPHSLVFSASPDKRFASRGGYVAVDDITFTEGPCSNECLFDRDLCTWTNNDTADNFDWSIGRSSTKIGTGPSKDQGSSLNTFVTTGGYAYVDSSYPRLPGDKAWLVSAALQPTAVPLCVKFWINIYGGGTGNFRSEYDIDDMYMKFDLHCYRNRPRETAALVSKPFTLTSDVCLSFWVYMSTTILSHIHIGALRVVLMYEAKNVTVWRLQNQQLTDWTYSQVTPPNTNSYVAIEGVQGPRVIGLMALDDIAVYPLSCPLEPATAAVQEADCPFDQDLCQWKVEADGRSSSPTMMWHLALNSKVLIDHTFNADEGGFAYIESFNTDQKSRMKSPFLPANTTFCLALWFSDIYEDNAAKLSVIRSSEGREETLWTVSQNVITDLPVSGYTTATWRYAQVLLPSHNTTYQLVIEGEVTRSAWAVDDILLIPGRTDCI